jgi:hypothetical protein
MHSRYEDKPRPNRVFFLLGDSRGPRSPVDLSTQLFRRGLHALLEEVDTTPTRKTELYSIDLDEGTGTLNYDGTQTMEDIPTIHVFSR